MVKRFDFCDRYGIKLHESENDSGEFVKYDDYAELRQTLSASRSYVAFEAKTGDAHALGLLRAIDKALKDD